MYQFTNFHSLYSMVVYMKSKFSLIIFITLIVSTSSCKKEKQVADLNTDMYVITKKGLVLRSKPSQTSEKISLLSYRTKVIAKQKSDSVETILNMTDRWYYIKSADKEGWAFGGFLDEYDPDIFVITKNSIGPAKLGMTFDEFLKYFKYDKIETNEYNMVVVYRNGNRILTLSDKNDGKTKIVKDFSVLYPKFKMSNGVHVGMTINELVNIYPKIEVKFEEDDYFAPFEMQTSKPDQSMDIVFLIIFRFDKLPTDLENSTITKSSIIDGYIAYISVYYYDK